MPEIKNIKEELLFAAPGAFALLFAGPAFYMSELDPIVRNQLESKKLQLQHWSKVYELGKKTMPKLAILGAAAAGYAYYKTKVAFWIYGAVTLLSVVPYTYLALMPTNKQLNAVLEETKEFAEIQEEKKAGVVEGMKRWVKLHRVRGILALGAAGLFFVARQLSNGKVV